MTIRRTVATRAAVAAAIGCFFAVLSYSILRSGGPSRLAADFTYSWLAARKLSAGLSAYTAPDPFPMPWGPGFIYPLPAALLAWPFSWLGARLAGAAFTGITAMILAFVATRAAWWPLILFLSGPAYHVAASAQWSFLFTAAGLAAPLLGVLSVKPQIALPILAFHRHRRAIGYAALGCGVLVGLSFLVRPTWLGEWRHELQTHPAMGQFRPPIVTAWGAVLVLAAFRWREPSARLVFLMACMPQNGFFYDQLPLLLVAETRRELLTMSVLSWVAYGLAIQIPWTDAPASIVSPQLMPYVIVGVYWPALVLVFRRRRAGELIHGSGGAPTT